MKSPVYAAPFTATLNLNSELAGTGLNVYLFGGSHGVLTITSNGDIISYRWTTGADTSTVLNLRKYMK